MAQIVAGSTDAWCSDQCQNPDNPRAYAALADELCRDLGRVDVLICSVGTGGHSAGVARGLRLHNPALRLVGVDSVGSAIFGQPARPRLMCGLGSSVHPRNVAYELFHEVHWVAPGEAAWVCRQLAAQRYVSGGWSVGAVALVASWIARREAPGSRVVAIFPDGPARYLGTIYNDDYCRTHGLLERPPQPDPDEISHPTQREVERWTRCATVVDPLAVAGAGATAGRQDHS